MPGPKWRAIRPEDLEFLLEEIAADRPEVRAKQLRELHLLMGGEVLALRAFGLRCSQSAPLVEAQISIPEPELQHILAELCERYGAGLHKKPRQRLLTVTAPRTFIDNVLQPVLQGMLDVVIASRHEQARRLVAELHASAPEETKPLS